MGFDGLAVVVGRAVRTGIGVALTHTPTTGTPTTGNWRFDLAYVPAVPKGETPASESRPTTWLWLADLATAPRAGDVIRRIATSTDYVIESIEPDGEGMARCYLTVSE